MDKNKVTKQLGNVEKYLLAYEKSGKNADIAMAFQQLHEAQDEVQKSDWISVEDELPPYEEEILVKNKNNPNATWITYRPSNKCPVMDKNGLSCPGFFGITHWCKIDKLEV